MPDKDFLTAAKSEILLVDGAMGTELTAAGAPDHDKMEWNVSHPEVIAGVLRTYMDAGADVVETCTFVASRPHLERTGYEGRTAEFVQAATRVAREAADGNAFVAASVGPTGRVLEPYGDLEPEEARDIFAEQISAHVAVGVDLILLETFIALEELEAAVEAAKQAAPGVPIAATMSFDRGERTSFGVDGETAGTRLVELGCDIVGGNCAYGDGLVTALEAMCEAVDVPVLCQANAGLPQLVEGETVFAAGPAEVAALGRRLKDVGVTLFGGCCGTTPDHIRALAEAVKNG
jgi:5-methyltetrahydrofolate--homocysteine methyltransferase